MATHSSVLAWRIPGTGGAWWAAFYGVTQSRTQLKQLSSSSCVKKYKCESESVWSLSHVLLFAIPWTVTCQAALSMGFSRQECWSGFAILFTRGFSPPWSLAKPVSKMIPPLKWNRCRKEDLFQGLKPGFCLTLRNKLSEETHVLTKQEILLRRGTQAESRRVREPRRTALPCGSFGFYGDGISFRVVLNQSFWLRVLPGGLAKMDAREDSGRWSDMWCLLLTFPELFQLVVAY